ncbi:MAG: fumarylacetoacetate hydrolase family protein [Rhodoferax sp.]|nr:fumarylacetoacetate hydrolase family protein [Rhodoferax sp.]
MRCFVNGELRQNANTSDLIFKIPTLIETLSAGITLYPGDVIATGVPVGVGIGFKPPKYLKSGDLVRVEIDGIGHLENPVR